MSNAVHLKNLCSPRTDLGFPKRLTFNNIFVDDTKNILQSTLEKV